MRRNVFLVCVGVWMITGCATSARPLVGPDGSPHYLISCEYGIQNCYERARETCQGNYEIINTSQRVSGVNDIVSSSNDLLIKCATSSPQSPQKADLPNS